MLIDLGKYYHDYLNALVLYMDDGLEKLELQVVPYAFKMTSSSKSAIHVSFLGKIKDNLIISDERIVGSSWRKIWFITGRRDFNDIDI